jgi:hypothetical protein
MEPSAIWKRMPSARSPAFQLNSVPWMAKTITTAKIVTRKTSTVERPSTTTYLLPRWIAMAMTTRMATQIPIDRNEYGSGPKGISEENAKAEAVMTPAWLVRNCRNISRMSQAIQPRLPIRGGTSS